MEILSSFLGKVSYSTVQYSTVQYSTVHIQEIFKEAEVPEIDSICYLSIFPNTVLFFQL